MSYWDTSTLVKLYVKESDSAIFENHFENAPGPQAISGIALYEARATFCRKEVDGLIPPGASQILYHRLLSDIASGAMTLVEIGTDLEREYGMILNICNQQLPPVLVRTLDAIHLASAKMAAQAEIVTTDRRMREAARLAGLAVFPA